MIKAECTWGDGPDVLLVAKDQEHNALFDLTRLQAFTLAQSLLAAVNQVDELEKIALQHDEAIKE